MSVPADAGRAELSHLVNSLLDLSPPRPFDFLVNGKYLQSTLSQHASVYLLGSEDELKVEYVFATLPPRDRQALDIDDWLSCIVPCADTLFPGLPRHSSLYGAYDGTIGVCRIQDGESGTGQSEPSRLAVARLFKAPVKSICPLEIGGETHLSAAGYEGRVFFARLSAGDSTSVGEGSASRRSGPMPFAFHSAFRLRDLGLPILSLCSVPRGPGLAIAGSASYVTIYSQEDLVAASEASGEPRRKKAEPSGENGNKGETSGRRVWLVKNPREEEIIQHFATRSEAPIALGPTVVAPGLSEPFRKQTAGAVYSSEQLTINSIKPFGPGLACGSSDNCVRVLDLELGKVSHVLPGPSVCQSVSPVTDVEVLAGYHDRTVRLYDARVQKSLVATFVGHKHSITCVDSAGAPARHFLSSCLGGVLNLWDLRAPTPLYTIDCFTRVRDHRRDQARTLACAIESPYAEAERGILAGGSDRRVSRWHVDW